MKKNIVQEKSYAFALRIVKLYRWLCEEKRSMFCQNNSLYPALPLGPMSRRLLAGSLKKTLPLK